jgi:hypothetical protein
LIEVVGIKRFILSNPDNQKWVDAQEKRLKSQRNVENVSQLGRCECFPQLFNDTISKAASSSYVRKDSLIVIEARQRQLHRSLMKELLKSTTEGKKTTSLYRTMTWEQKSKAIFFYFHESLGNMDQKSTCCVFSMNVLTFRN